MDAMPLLKPLAGFLSPHHIGPSGDCRALLADADCGCTSGKAAGGEPTRTEMLAVVRGVDLTRLGRASR
jgi:hypothetical protein